MAVGDVDGDTLLALGLQPVHQQGEIEPGFAAAAGILGESGELVVRDHAGIVQQAADQGGFAVVHAAAGEEAEQPGIACGGVHQK